MSEKKNSSAQGQPNFNANPAAAQAELVDLLMRFRGGDREAYQEIFNRFNFDLLMVVRKFFHSPFDQEDALQESWIKIFRMREHVDVNRHAEFRGWLRQVTRNRCLDMFKERGRGHEIPSTNLDTEIAVHETQTEETINVKMQAAISTFISKLPEQEREFFTLCFIEELGHETIAARLGFNERRSKYLKKKILARLMKDLSLRRQWDR